MPNPNPPAFPQALLNHASGQTFASYEVPDGAGMTLRDYFAGQALQSVMHARVALVNADLVNDLSQESIAEECYELADAMLAERERAR